VRRVDPRLTRRAALGGLAALGLASCGGGDPPPTTGPQAGSGAALLSSLIALENASVAAWEAIAGRLDGEARRYAEAIRRRESGHAERLGGLVRDLGGTPPEGRPPEEYSRLFPNLADASDALHFAADLEERLVRAYLDALHALPDEDQRRAALEIAADEAQDLGVVHVLAGGRAAPEPFVTGTS
jgi:hypothetical protein